MNNQLTSIEDLEKRVADLIQVLKVKDKKQEIAKLEKDSLQEGFWDNKDKAQMVMQNLSGLKEEIEMIAKTKKKITDFKSLIANAGDDDQQTLSSELESLDKELKKIELNKYLSGKYDAANAIISIHAGQGGTEAMDWAEMLKRMYLRHAERRGWKTQVMNESLGEEAGVKSVTITVTGRNAYGYLKKEKGTHRLVRQSPFNADNLRQTSFALVGVMPVIENEIEIEVKPDDVEIEFYRSSGSGGQNVNKVSTAVRLKHKSTGIVVESQAQRYQEQNRKNALNILKGMLWQRQEEKLAKQKQQIKGEHKQASWGNQIRSYVLHPYKQVKDLRTEHIDKNPEAVLDGKLDGFIEAQLKLSI